MGVMGSGHGELGVEEVEESVPELGSESRVAVRDDFLGKAMEREDSVKEELKSL